MDNFDIIYMILSFLHPEELYEYIVINSTFYQVCKKLMKKCFSLRLSIRHENFYNTGGYLMEIITNNKMHFYRFAVIDCNKERLSFLHIPSNTITHEIYNNLLTIEDGHANLLLKQENFPVTINISRLACYQNAETFSKEYVTKNICGTFKLAQKSICDRDSAQIKFGISFFAEIQRKEIGYYDMTFNKSTIVYKMLFSSKK